VSTTWWWRQLAETYSAAILDADPAPHVPEPAMSHPNRAGLAIEVRRLPAGATEADWHDAVTALID
jgi:hypothetical protein